MKKIIYSILIVLLVTLFWFYFMKPSPKVDNTTTTYRNTNLGISFVYPKILFASTTSEAVRIHHEVPFVHHDYCDFKGEGDTTIPYLTDFNVTFHTSDMGLVETMKSESPYIPEENFVNGKVVPSPGFIDSYTVGKLNGFRIFEGAEGCGQTTYYFPITNSKTLVVSEEMVTVFTGAIDVANEERAKAVPGVINKENASEIFESIMKTIKID